MKEISLILKNNLLITIEEFRILDRYSCSGKIWTLIQKPTPITPYKMSYRTVEYIFDSDAVTFFCIVSQNVLASWDTSQTKELGPDEEFCIKDSLFIRQYSTHY